MFEISVGTGIVIAASVLGGCLTLIKFIQMNRPQESERMAKIEIKIEHNDESIKKLQDLFLKFLSEKHE